MPEAGDHHPGELTRVARRRDRRRRALRIGGATLAVVVLGGAGIAYLLTRDDGSDVASSVRTRGSTTTSSTTTTAAPVVTEPPTTTVAPAPAGPDLDRTYAVGVHGVTFVDGSRATSPNGSFGGSGERTLPTTVWYPAAGDPAGPVLGDAPVAPGAPYPLIVFSHGYAVTPSFYVPMLERWAAAGFVVAAPTYPILSGSPGGASHVDYEETFADTSFVIDRMLGISGDVLAGASDPAKIAAAGHSDGEVISFGVGLLACCRDPRVKAVIAMAGDLSNANNPHQRDSGVPILHVMETDDEYDPYPHSIAWDRENLTAPRWMLTLTGASHVPPYTRPGDAHFELLAGIVPDFLDGVLQGRQDRLDRLAASVAARPDLASLER